MDGDDGQINLHQQKRRKVVVEEFTITYYFAIPQLKYRRMEQTISFF